MRTTIDLPEDLHRIATSIARDRRETLSATVADLLRTALGQDTDGPRIVVSPRTGLKVITGTGPITTEDVRALEDEW